MFSLSKHILSRSHSRKSPCSSMKMDPRFYRWSKVVLRAKVWNIGKKNMLSWMFHSKPLHYYLCHYLCLSRWVSRISNSDTRLKNVPHFFLHAFMPVWCCCVGQAMAGMLGYQSCQAQLWSEEDKRNMHDWNYSTVSGSPPPTFASLPLSQTLSLSSFLLTLLTFCLTFHHLTRSKIRLPTLLAKPDSALDNCGKQSNRAAQSLSLFPSLKNTNTAWCMHRSSLKALTNG